MLHFAYGSNLSTARLQARIGPVQKVQVLPLYQRSLHFHKKSQDGSGKADAWLTHEDRDVVWGVVWRISPQQKKLLDQYEGLGSGYEERFETVSIHHKKQSIQFYVAMPHAIQPGLKPYDWYHAFVMAGAIEHGLPEDYIDGIREVSTQLDPDEARTRRNKALLEKG